MRIGYSTIEAISSHHHTSPFFLCRTSARTRRRMTTRGAWTGRYTWLLEAEAPVFHHSRPCSLSGVSSETWTTDLWRWLHSTTQICCSSTRRVQMAKCTTLSRFRGIIGMSWPAPLIAARARPSPRDWYSSVHAFVIFLWFLYVGFAFLLTFYMIGIKRSFFYWSWFSAFSVYFLCCSCSEFSN